MVDNAVGSGGGPLTIKKYHCRVASVVVQVHAQRVIGQPGTCLICVNSVGLSNKQYRLNLTTSGGGMHLRTNTLGTDSLVQVPVALSEPTDQVDACCSARARRTSAAQSLF